MREKVLLLVDLRKYLTPRNIPQEIVSHRRYKFLKE